MEIAELSNTLRHLGGSGFEEHGSGIMALYFANWLKRLPSDRYFAPWHLPRLPICAYDDLVNSSSKSAKDARVAYEQKTGNKLCPMFSMSDANRIAFADVVDRVTAAAVIADRLEVVSAEKFLTEWKYRALWAATLFIHRVYINGRMHRVIEACEYAGMHGVFGGTELRKLDTCGSRVLTFARPSGENREDSVTLIWEDGDQYPYDFGVQSWYGPDKTLLSMLQEVEAKWPRTFASQKRIFWHDAEYPIGI